MLTFNKQILIITVTIPVTPKGTAPSVELSVEADSGARQAPLDSKSCVLSFNEFASPVVVLARGRDADEGVRNVRIEGQIRLFCGAGDCIDALTDTILEEIVDDASPGEEGRISRNVLRLILFGDLNAICAEQSVCGGLDVRNVNLEVKGEVENFHGQTAATPLFQCLLDFVGPPPAP